MKKARPINRGSRLSHLETCLPTLLQIAEAARRRDGSKGPASEVRRIDPHSPEGRRSSPGWRMAVKRASYSTADLIVAASMAGAGASAGEIAQAIGYGMTAVNVYSLLSRFGIRLIPNDLPLWRLESRCLICPRARM